MKIQVAALAAILVSCSASCTRQQAKQMKPIAHDIHSFGNPAQVRTTHLALNLEVLFAQRTLRGTALLSIAHTDPTAKELVLDTRALQIDETEVSRDGVKYVESRFEKGKPDPILGAPLRIQIEAETKFVRIRYSTSPGAATALQWLAPEQTAARQHPFLYTQGEAILTRSWIPLQDSPGVRITYEARIKVPTGMKAVMSATNCPGQSDCPFVMDQPIPPYLIALAVGDLHFKATGPRTGVWAEPPILEKAAAEFSDTERMVAAAEKLYGPYRWTRYDLLVLPPSFPFGGMENPRLTFATPTILAGDKSLVSLVAHELAHSWSGNLVTNATWSDFWLNEGYTVYIERRILEELYGKPRAEMEAALGVRDLQNELKSTPASDQILCINLEGRDPDDGMTSIPYEKGALFLRTAEQQFGREKFDAYLRTYFDRFAFQSITTREALSFLQETLGAPVHDTNQWVYQPGLPANAPLPVAAAFTAIDKKVPVWLGGDQIQTAAWSPHEWIHFLQDFPEKPALAEMDRLDSDFHLTATTNDEILAQWLLMAVHARYAPANSRLEEFLTTVGRRKYVKPLYEALLQTGDTGHARNIYDKARPLYHPITQQTIDTLFAKNENSTAGTPKK